MNQGKKTKDLGVWTQTPLKYVDWVELKGKIDDVAKEDAMLTEHFGWLEGKILSFVFYSLQAKALCLFIEKKQKTSWLPFWF